MGMKRATIAILGLILATAMMVPKDSSGGLNPGAAEKSAAIAPRNPDFSEAALGEIFSGQSEDHSMRWFYSNPPGKPKGAALVIHGLNLRPDRMLPIIAKLTAAGIDVLALSLRGHGINYAHGNDGSEDQARLQAFKNVSYRLWANEAYLAYLQLKERSEHLGTPRFLCGFSLGGLIGLDLFASNADVRFDKVILFAPAIRLRAVVYLERLLSPFPGLVIPSMAPKAYLANKKGTPIAAYNALFDGLDRFNKNAGQKLNVPTLIFIDRQDEFIPLEKLEQLVEEKKLNQWQFYIVEKDASVREKAFYHHIVDPSSTGNAVWQDMMTAVANHLLNQKSQ
jgi:alpha-beta hydrolase superfamily lysophospholipase